MSPLFQAVIEATEEAIYNSLFVAETVTGYRGRIVRQLPVERALALKLSGIVHPGYASVREFDQEARGD
jgi:D-aminopeptidase